MIDVSQVKKLVSVLALVATVLVSATGPALAAPKVVTSIKPVQAMVAAVTGEIGTPDLLLDPGTSPHSFTLRPSQAAMLENADIVFWIGPDLEVALADPLRDTGRDAHVVTLMDAPGLNLMAYDEDGDDNGQDDNGPIDPHLWLSPDNVIALTDHIAAELTRISPGNGDIFAHNAKVAKNRMKLLKRQAGAMLEPVKDTPYMVQHDGFGYLARDFGLNEVGHLQTLPGHEPGARHVAQVRDAIAERGVVCLFHEPQFTPALARRLARETNVRLAELDPLGADLEVSRTLSVRILQELALAMTTCLTTLTESEQ